MTLRSFILAFASLGAGFLVSPLLLMQVAWPNSHGLTVFLNAFACTFVAGFVLSLLSRFSSRVELGKATIGVLVCIPLFWTAWIVYFRRAWLLSEIYIMEDALAGVILGLFVVVSLVRRYFPLRFDPSRRDTGSIQPVRRYPDFEVKDSTLMLIVAVGAVIASLLLLRILFPEN